MLLILVQGCSTAEPGVPETSRELAGDDIIRFPVNADGSVDTTQVAKISFEETSYDFGTVDAGALVTHRFTFRNTGLQPLIITSAKSTCGCTVPQYPKRPIATGDTASVFVKFDTNGKAGPQSKPVTLTANTYPNETSIRVVGMVHQRR